MISSRDRQAWLIARRKGITGTDIAAILGLSPWRTPLDVYLEKVEGAQSKLASEAAWWGSYLEEGMARRYAEITQLGKGELLRGAAIAAAFPKKRIQVFGSGPGAQVLISHREFPFLLSTTDGLIPSRRKGLELKTAGWYGADEWGEQGTDQVPAYYLTQTALYMAVTEYPTWDLAALIGMGARMSGSLALYYLERNRALESEIVGAAVRFWRMNVQKKIPPAIDGTQSWQAYLAKKYARASGVTIPATQAINVLAAQYRDAQRRRQQAESDELLIRNRLADIVRHADRARGAFGSIGWVRPGLKKIIDWERLARSLGATDAKIARYTRTEQDQPYLRAWWSRKETKK